MSNAQSVILTGAAGGVGMKALRLLIDSGYVVYAGAIDDWEFERIVQLKNSLQTEAIIPVRLDLRDREQIDQVVSTVERDHPRFAALITNGASAPVGVPLEYAKVDFAREVFEINVFGNLYLIQRCLKLLKQNRGRIVHVSSLFGKTAAAMQLAYASSKHAGEGLLMTIRRELAPHGIKVVMINPGVIWGTFMIAHQYEGSKRTVAAMDGCSPNEVGNLSLDEGENSAISQPEMVTDHSYRENYLGIIKAAEPGLGPDKKLSSSPDLVASYILKGVTEKRPRIRYVSGWDSKILITMTRFLPERLMDWISSKLV